MRPLQRRDGTVRAAFKQPLLNGPRSAVAYGSARAEVQPVDEPSAIRFVPNSFRSRLVAGSRTFSRCRRTCGCRKLVWAADLRLCPSLGLPGTVALGANGTISHRRTAAIRCANRSGWPISVGANRPFRTVPQTGRRRAGSTQQCRSGSRTGARQPRRRYSCMSPLSRVRICNNRYAGSLVAFEFDRASSMRAWMRFAYSSLITNCTSRSPSV
jgi:hypothetical protein